MNRTTRIMCLVVLVSLGGGLANSQQLNLDKNNADKGNNIQYIKNDSIGLSYDPCAYKIRCGPLESTNSNLLTSNLFNDFAAILSKKEQCKIECDKDHDLAVQMCLVHAPKGSQTSCIAQAMNVYGACLKRCG